MDVRRNSSKGNSSTFHSSITDGEGRPWIGVATLFIIFFFGRGGGRNCVSPTTDFHQQKRMEEEKQFTNTVFFLYYTSHTHTHTPLFTYYLPPVRNEEGALESPNSQC